eukprot:CAMPEP_0204383420 /NCGR_PEP_ID=MMETSP0469-20131031/55988_1 /ASSEMBLY_ACC=CAM_ASM_000384 /TAXON_ID=2969 /ORGANISM="Oxyrrhis marina" /LENGTH=66 /DNA_ID=CAMNT_0051375761 /DNA_START=26 /DNA_END=222 /DNA_ORIENTATION=+
MKHMQHLRRSCPNRTPPASRQDALAWAGVVGAPGVVGVADGSHMQHMQHLRRSCPNRIPPATGQEA